MSEIKNLELIIKEEQNRIKILQAKQQTSRIIIKAFPDAVSGILEDSSAGRQVFFSTSIKAETEKAKPIIYYVPPKASSAGRFMLRFYIQVGREKVYSLYSQPIQNSSVSDMLNKYISMPSGSAFIAGCLPKPISP